MGVGSLSRSRPFDIQSFFDSQLHSLKMAGDLEKDRTSGEIIRADVAAPILPTVNPAAVQPEPQKASLHPAFYVV